MIDLTVATCDDQCGGDNQIMETNTMGFLMWCVAWICGTVSAQEVSNSSEPGDAAPPVEPEALQQWWKAAGQLRLGDTAYRVTEEVQFKDGVCDVRLNEGMLIPVYTGKAPVSERVVGIVFVGDGDLSVRFPERADAWTFANHMVRWGGQERSKMAPIAAQRSNYSVDIKQGLILSADPRVQKLIYNLEPVGGGVLFTETQDGEADATYVVTEKRGRLRTRIVATDVLADRSDALQRLGLDPRAMLRQDRLLQEELGFPGHYVRAVSEWQTKDRYHVAAQGTSVSDMDYDKWMSCYRDGRDEAGLGYRAIAFAHGRDLDKRQHFQRFSGLSFMPATEGDMVRPSFRMQPVSAEGTIEVFNTRSKLYQRVTADTELVFEADGADLQYLPLRLPTSGSERGSWVMDALQVQDESGQWQDLAWVGLNSDLTDTGGLRRSRIPLHEVDLDNQQVSMEDNDSLTSGIPQLATSTTELTAMSSGTQASGDSNVSAANPQSISTAKIAQPEGPANFRLNPNEQIVAQSERTVQRISEYTYDIVALLPKPVTAGERVKLRLKWSAQWGFGNFSTIEMPDGVAVRTLGTTTGVHPVLPEVLPIAGGTRWDFELKTGTKSPLLRPQYIVSSGDSVRTWQDEGMWNWTLSSGKNALSPSIGIGRWEVLEEATVEGLPSVRVSIFPQNASKATQFAPEIRRILTFFHDFLPAYDQQEVDVVQDRSLVINEFRRPSREQVIHGIVQVQTIAPSAVGLTNELRDEDSKRAQTQIARQLAGQYWGQRVAPNTERDEWITTALADAYAMYYVRAAFGSEEHNARVTGIRNILENPEEQDLGWTNRDARRRTYSPAGSTRLSDVPKKFREDYAVYVLSEMLRLQIGNQAYFSALESLAKKSRVDSKSLQREFEQASGQDLSDFFDFWVYGGYIPKITTDVRHDKSGIIGCVQSDVPFGKIMVPIRIVLEDKSIDTLVEVKHGKGMFEIPNVTEADFEVDPLGLLIAFERSVQRTDKPTACE